jgi:uncharacterized protein
MIRFLAFLPTTTLFLTCFFVSAQNIGVFNSVAPNGQTHVLTLPNTHTFQLLAQLGDTLANGSTLKTHPDFTAFVPRFGRSDRGYLSLNHEIGNLQGGVTVFDLAFDKMTRQWSLYNGLPVDFSAYHGTSRPCSGAVTPWGTVIYGEEAIAATDADSNGYYDAGWLVEIKPDTREVLQKIWKAGNAIHENCAVASDQKTLYWGADDAARGFVFKYIATQKRQFQDGLLYVLVRDSIHTANGFWLQVPNTTPQECNNINSFCVANGAFNFSGIEDVEIGPYGRVYFSTKHSGRVWRFKDNGATVSGLTVWVDNIEYAIETDSGTHMVRWGIGADNMAFDNAHNLWVLQDGGDDNIWMIHATHSPSNPKISLFATTPIGSEPTGITFSPDYRFMFLSLQHPASFITDTVMDARNKPTVFNRGTTLVIARKEFLGKSPDMPLPAPTSALQTYPNPAKGGAAVTFTHIGLPSGAVLHLHLTNAQGKNVWEATAPVQSDQVVYSLPPTLSAGWYSAHLTGPGYFVSTALLVHQ